jgi:hypothetical protein
MSDEAQGSIALEQLGLAGVLKQFQLTVPLNQREYSWEKEHVEQMFDDLAEALRNGDEHFFGTIVTIPRQRRLEVVDGQQRLATTAILLAAMRDYLRRIDDEVLVESLNNEFLTGIHRRERQRIPKLALNADDNALFSEIVTGENLHLLRRSSVLSLRERIPKRFFRDHPAACPACRQPPSSFPLKPWRSPRADATPDSRGGAAVATYLPDSRSASCSATGLERTRQGFRDGDCRVCKSSVVTTVPSPSSRRSCDGSSRFSVASVAKVRGQHRRPWVRRFATMPQGNRGRLELCEANRIANSPTPSVGPASNPVVRLGASRSSSERRARPSPPRLSVRA